MQEVKLTRYAPVVLAIAVAVMLFALSMVSYAARAEDEAPSTPPTTEPSADATGEPSDAPARDTDAVDICPDAVAGDRLNLEKFRLSKAVDGIPGLATATFSDSNDGVVMSVGRYDVEFVRTDSVMQILVPGDLPQELLSAAVSVADEVKYDC